MIYIGIDLGTSSVKILAINESGEELFSVSKNFTVNYFNEIWAEQNPNDWWNQTLKGFKELIKNIDKDQIQAISFSGQMHGLVILDSLDNVLRPSIIWCDQRSFEECTDIENHFGKEKISNITGNMAIPGFTATKLLWVKKHEREIFNKISKIMLPKDYLIYKFSEIFATDFSDASGTLILDVKNKKWSSEIINYLGLKEEQLPKLHDSCDIVGNISKTLANNLEICENVKIIAGGGDQAIGAIGAGVCKSNSIAIALGTSGVVFAPLDEYAVSKDNLLHTFCHANRKFHQMGVMLSAAASLKWWKENIQPLDNYDKLLSNAANVEVGSENLFFLPYLIGERTPHNNPNARGNFIGLSMMHKKEHLTRAVLEGVAYGIRDMYELIIESNKNIKYAVISGGGAKSKLWKQIIADVLNIDCYTVSENLGPAYGAALVAYAGMYTFNSKKFSTIEDICAKFVNLKNKITPNIENYKIYSEKYIEFKELYRKLYK